MPNNARWNIRKSDILYEDAWIMAINKPSGIPSQGTLDPNRDHAFAAVQRYLAAQNPNAYAGLHHRLDAQTSGVLLLSKSPEANPSLSEQFQKHTIQKAYCAVCQGARSFMHQEICARTPFLIDAPIGELPGKIQKFGVDGKKRKPAQTDVVCEKIIELRDCLVGVFRCFPRTGRTHQIRVHLSSRGMSILGDALYGDPTARSLRPIEPKRMMLHAESITFVHPVTGEPMTIAAERPTEFGDFIRKCEKMARALGMRDHTPGMPFTR